MRKRSHTRVLLAYKKFCMEKDQNKYEAKSKRQLASKRAALQAKFLQDLSALKAKLVILSTGLQIITLATTTIE